MIQIQIHCIMQMHMHMHMQMHCTDKNVRRYIRHFFPSYVVRRRRCGFDIMDYLLMKVDVFR